ncbi:SAM15 protein, partial [Polyodon spathula]|nr:SAM15 protein [Polyodon spathula]
MCLFSQACFTENYISGRKLILVNCSTLPTLGVTHFKDMNAISGHICDLLEVKDPHWIQSIALPPVEPRRLFLEEKSRTGSTADSFTYIQYLKERGLDEYT